MPLSKKNYELYQKVREGENCLSLLMSYSAPILIISKLLSEAKRNNDQTFLDNFSWQCSQIVLHLQKNGQFNAVSLGFLLSFCNASLEKFIKYYSISEASTQKNDNRLLLQELVNQPVLLQRLDLSVSTLRNLFSTISTINLNTNSNEIQELSTITSQENNILNSDAQHLKHGIMGLGNISDELAFVIANNKQLWSLFDPLQLHPIKYGWFGWLFKTALETDKQSLAARHRFFEHVLTSKSFAFTLRSIDIPKIKDESAFLRRRNSIDVKKLSFFREKQRNNVSSGKLLIQNNTSQGTPVNPIVFTPVHISSSKTPIQDCSFSPSQTPVKTLLLKSIQTSPVSAVAILSQPAKRGRSLSLPIPSKSSFFPATPVKDLCDSHYLIETKNQVSHDGTPVKDLLVEQSVITSSSSQNTPSGTPVNGLPKRRCTPRGRTLSGTPVLANTPGGTPVRSLLSVGTPFTTPINSQGTPVRSLVKSPNNSPPSSPYKI